MKIRILNIVLVLFIGFLLYNSVYFESLENRRAKMTDKVFDAASFSKNLMDNQIDKVPTMDIVDFLNAAEINFDLLMESEGKRLGVSNERYFMVEGEANIIDVTADDLILQLKDNRNSKIKIATNFIYGNTLRDASGLVSISDYANTMDFNNISIEMNHIVREKILPPVIKNLEIGNRVNFKGTLKVNITSNDQNLRIIPISLTQVQQNE